MLPCYYVVIKMLLLSVGGIIAIAILIMICGNVAMFYPDVAIVCWWHRCNGSDSNVAMLYLDVAVLLCCDNKVPMFYLDVAIVCWWHHCN